MKNKQSVDRKDQKNEDQLNIWKERYLRALADYQNLEKRVQATREDDLKYAGQTLILKMLPVLDILEKAQQTIKDKGLEIALNQFRLVLENESVKKIDVLGKKFDPELMECIEITDVNSKEQNNCVLEELRSGYKMLEKVIRVAHVKVGKKK